MGFFHDSRFSVLATGITAVSLILWLSISFWLDAWQQRHDARQMTELAAVEQQLTTTMRLLERERLTTIDATVVDGAQRTASGANPDAELALIRTRSENSFATALLSTETLLAKRDVGDHLRYSPAALASAHQALIAAHHSLQQRRETFDMHLQVWRGDGAPSGFQQTLNAALNLHRSATRLLDRMREIQRGLEYSTMRTTPHTESLRRVRWILEETSASLLSKAALLPESPESKTALDRNRLPHLDTAHGDTDRRLRLAMQGLEVTAREGAITNNLRLQLQMLNTSYRSVGLSRQAAEVLYRDSVRIEELVAAQLMQQNADMEAHAVRRLIIDSIVIVVCLWIGLATLRLLVQIRDQAYRDRLTGLPNRAYIEEFVCKLLAADEHHQPGPAVVLLDVDQFRSINDTVGHNAGDELLKQLSERLSTRVQKPAVLAALGGDEWGVVVPHFNDREAVVALAVTLREACDEAFELQGAALRITLSAGLSFAGEHDNHAPGLLQRANIALRQAKDLGRDRVQCYSKALAEQSLERIRLEADLRQAVSNGELELHYQPKVVIASAQVSGTEALLRWRHPVHGIVSPGLFIPVAEETGLIKEIGSWVLYEAVRQNAEWYHSGQANLQVAVNVSSQQMSSEDFPSIVFQALKMHQLPAAMLELEITESVGMLDMAMVVQKLSDLRAEGIRIAIDDFGTDYSSLQYLADLPVDTLKIDRAFVTRLDDTQHDRSLVNTIIVMARSFGLQTVAEGVENQAQLDKIAALGCDYVQGFHYARPTPAEELLAVIAAIDSSAPSEVQRAA